MNTQEVSVPRGNRRRKASTNLNAVPGDQEAISTSVRSPIVHTVLSQSVPTTIDVDAIEDDVVELSASDFAEVKNKSRNASISNKRRRVPSTEPVIDCEHASVNPIEVIMSLRLSRSKAPAPPPEEPKFTCPICMCPFTEEMSTKCGHIFCKACIKTAISRQSKCPTCRKKVSAKELIRVFLPATTR